MSIDRSRSLRKRMSPAEARMWNLLRGEVFRSFHFRRQVQLRDFYADFASHSSRLVIEVDGDTHGPEEARAYDAAREAFIRSEGYDIYRATNSDVMHNLAGVASELMTILELAPTPAQRRRPSPQGGGMGTLPVRSALSPPRGEGGEQSEPGGGQNL